MDSSGRIPKRICKAAVNIMDYLNVGANGFAQVGNESYFAKSKVEMNYLFHLVSEKFPIPEELKMLCSFAVKAFPHDFGTYHEIVLHFDDEQIGDGSDEEDAFSHISEEEFKNCIDNNLVLPPQPSSLHETFWDWFREVESFNLETEEITEVIQTKYLATLDTSKGEHLRILQVKRAS